MLQLSATDMLSSCRKSFLFYSLLLAIFLSGCSLLPNRIKTAEKLLSTNPDSTLKILKSIESVSTLSNSERALYGVLLFEALDKTKQTLGPDSIINYSIEYYQTKKDKEKLPLCLYYKARLYKSAQQFENSTNMYLHALDFLKDGENFVLIAKIYSDLGYICNFQHDYNRAREKYQLSAQFFNEAKMPIEANYRLLNIGTTYRNEKNYNVALGNFRKVLSSTNDSMLLGATFQEIGVVYYLMGKSDSATFYLRKSLSYPYKQDDYSIRTYVFADYWFNTEKYDSAYFYADKALKYPSNFFTKRECYRILANTSYLQGDYKGMAGFMTSFQACTDSLRTIEAQTKTTVLEDIHQSNVVAGKNKRNFLIAGALLLILSVAGFFIFVKLRKRNKDNESDLVQKSEELGQYQVQLTKKDNQLRNTLIQKIEDTRKIEAAAYKKAAIADKPLIEKRIFENSLHFSNWPKFKTLMDGTFNNIITNLETEYPQISKKEIMLCCLYLCDLSSPEMAIVLDVQPTGVYKLKQRLATKMNLAGTKELNQLLDEMSVSNKK